MKIKTISRDGWAIYHPACGRVQAEKILEINHQRPECVLRDHHRSHVNRIDFEDEQYVVKIPNNKNKSMWIRFTTLYRDSEVVRDLKSQLLLKSLNINAVEPVAALEKRKFGMVVDSRIIYEYRDGQEISVDHYPGMMDIMKILHANGYLHDDPHTKNFLQKDNEVFAIDCKPRTNVFGKVGIAHNFIILARRSAHAREVYKLVGSSPSDNSVYKLINILVNSQQCRRAVKNAIKSRLGMNYKHGK